LGGKEKMKFRELMNKDVFVEKMKIGKIKDIAIDTEEWKVTHLELELTKEAAEQLLGSKSSGVHNMLAISALEKGTACCTDKGVDIKVSKAQLRIYLKPA
jgi:sporulation protein YlmC with PRC-barrel domain